jgi:hypothetical protein
VTDVDTKAGFCSNCRRGDHTLCGSPSCTCPDMRKHRNRPGFAVVGDTPKRIPTLAVQRATSDQHDPVWCDPPVVARRGATVDYKALAAPCLGRPSAWLRLKLYKAKSGAGSAAKKCKAALGEGWEVRAVRIPEGSGLWVRWMGEED